MLPGESISGKPAPYKEAHSALLTDDSLSNNMYLFMLNFGKGGAFISLAQIFVIFSWIGAMSHMFGDMSTREGAPSLVDISPNM